MLLNQYVLSALYLKELNLTLHSLEKQRASHENTSFEKAFI